MCNMTNQCLKTALSNITGVLGSNNYIEQLTIVLGALMTCCNTGTLASASNDADLILENVLGA